MVNMTKARFPGKMQVVDMYFLSIISYEITAEHVVAYNKLQNIDLVLLCSLISKYKPPSNPNTCVKVITLGGITEIML